MQMVGFLASKEFAMPEPVSKLSGRVLKYESLKTHSVGAGETLSELRIVAVGILRRPSLIIL